MEGLGKHFEDAAEKIKVHGKNIADNDLLIIYSLYKQAIVGDCNTARPGMLDFKGKAKWDAWDKIKGKSKEDARKEYVETVMKFLPDEVKAKYN